MENWPSHSLSIGPLKLSSPLALAPMAGVSHSAFRRMILSLGGCGLVYTEMINAAAFTPRALRSHGMLDFQPQERPLAAQISGHDPALFAQAAATAEARGVDIVDINAGCPVPSVTKSGGGSALLKELDLLAAILQAVRRAVRIPVTLKYRSGWSEGRIVAVEVARLAEGCGCAAIALHPRTRTQRYSGRADWELIRAVVEAVRIPVLASGDIRSVDDARNCLQETGAAGLMIGRGVMRNPWLIAQIAAALAGRSPQQPSPEDRYHFLRRYCELLEQERSREIWRLGKLKQFVGKFHTGLPNRTAFRKQVMSSGSVEEAWQAIGAYFGAYVKQAALAGEAIPAESSPPRPSFGGKR